MLTRTDVNMLVMHHTMTSDRLRSLTSEQYRGYMAWQSGLPLVSEWCWSGAGDYVTHTATRPIVCMQQIGNGVFEYTAVLHTYAKRIDNDPVFSAMSARQIRVLGGVIHEDVWEEPRTAWLGEPIWSSKAILHYCKRELEERIEQWELSK